MAQHQHQHPRMTFIGNGETVTVTGSGGNTEYILSGEGQGPASFATAHLVINRPQAFHGEIQLGDYSQVTLYGIWASSFSYDVSRDLLKLYQGDTVVDTIDLHVPGATGNPFPFIQSSHPPGPSWVAFGTGYHGLSYGIDPHV